MKKNFLTIPTLLISGLLWAQVGINTETPTATLDVVSSDQHEFVVQSLNSDGEVIFQVSQSGNVNLTGALMPEGNPGEEGLYLISRGEENPPEWGILPSGATVQVFSGQKDDIASVRTAMQTVERLDFPIINSSPNPEYLEWDSVNKQFVVNKRGSYLITVGVEAVDMRNTSNQPNPNGNLALFISTTPYSITGPGVIFQQGSQYNYSVAVSTSVILEPGNTIHFSVNSGGSSFRVGPTFASINYSEIP